MTSQILFSWALCFCGCSHFFTLFITCIIMPDVGELHHLTDVIKFCKVSLATPVCAGSRLGAGQDPLLPHSVPARLSISACPSVS